MMASGWEQSLSSRLLPPQRPDGELWELLHNCQFSASRDNLSVKSLKLALVLPWKIKVGRGLEGNFPSNYFSNYHAAKQTLSVPLNGEGRHPAVIKISKIPEQSPWYGEERQRHVLVTPPPRTCAPHVLVPHPHGGPECELVFEAYFFMTLQTDCVAMATSISKLLLFEPWQVGRGDRATSGLFPKAAIERKTTFTDLKSFAWETCLLYS
jgi:hypothetical protein